MAKSVLDIVINMVKQGGGDQQTVSSLISVKNAVGGAMTVFGMLAGAGLVLNQVYQKTAAVFLDYAGQVRDMARMTGMGAEETSKLIQAADDLGISYESLQKSMWAASKQGIDVSVASLAKLADQYVAIQSPAERAEMLAKTFGKSGAEMGKLMEKGSQGVISMTNAISGSLVLTEEAVQSARRLEIAQDAIGDAILGAKVAAGGTVSAWWTDALNGILITIEAYRLMKEENFGLSQAFEVATRQVAFNEQQLLSQADAAGVAAQAQQELAAQTQATTQANQSMLSLMGQLQSETDSYAQKQADLAQKLADLNAQQEQVPTWSQKYKDLQGAIDATTEEVDQLAQEHEEAGKRIAFSLIQQKAAMDGLTESEFQSLIALGVQWGIYDETVAATALSMDEQAGIMAEAMDKPTEATQGIIKEIERLRGLSGNIDFIVNIKTKGKVPSFTGGGGGGGGGGGASLSPTLQMAAGGGQLNGNDWTMVGEEGPELISPHGYVFSNEQSQALIQAGLAPGAGMAGGGSLSKSNSTTVNISNSDITNLLGQILEAFRRMENNLPRTLAAQLQQVMP
jgi:hypothetical protein